MKRLIWLTLPAIIIVLVFSFFYFKNSKTTNDLQQSATTQTEEATSTPTTDKSFHIDVVGKKLKNPEPIQVKTGDNVTLTIVSDQDEELHLHGYDKSVELKATIQSELKFKADISGVM